MDRYSGKRGTTGSMAPRKAYKMGAIDSTTSKDQSSQFCNRIGCQGRIKYSNQNTGIGSSDKSKCSKPSFCSSNGNEVDGNSTRSGSAITRARSSYLVSKRKLSSRSEVDQSESSQSGNSEGPQLMCSSDASPSSHHSVSTNKSTETKFRSSSVPSNIRPRKVVQHKLGSTMQNTGSASSVPSTSNSSGLGTQNNSNKSRCLRNLKCNSISDVVPSNCSSSGSKSVGKNVPKKRSSEGESSLSRRGRNTTATASVDRHASASTSGASISASRRSSCTPGGYSNGAVSVRTGKSTYENQNRTGLSYRQNGRNSSCGRDPAFPISQFPDSEPRTNVGSSRFLHPFSAHGSSSASSSYSLSNNDDNQSLFNSSDLSFSHLMNRDALQRYSNMDGIAEVLLELERIEQDEEMTHEQILALETSLFLSSLSLYDQHRDMRLDIDNMSYEELLALGDRMGTVSTALSEDALLHCVKRSKYQMNQSEERFTGSGKDGDDVNCSICQEEYVTGDEIGKLVECHHVYHTACINQWLRLKNWCPICKTAAAPQQS